jgi:hypothetical protein
VIKCDQLQSTVCDQLQSNAINDFHCLLRIGQATNKKWFFLLTAVCDAGWCLLFAAFVTVRCRQTGLSTRPFLMPDKDEDAPTVSSGFAHSISDIASPGIEPKKRAESKSFYVDHKTNFVIINVIKCDQM